MRSADIRCIPRSWSSSISGCWRLDGGQGENDGGERARFWAHAFQRALNQIMRGTFPPDSVHKFAIFSYLRPIFLLQLPLGEGVGCWALSAKDLRPALSREVRNRTKKIELFLFCAFTGYSSANGRLEIFALLSASQGVGEAFRHLTIWG